jgi:hypothetical protein
MDAGILFAVERYNAITAALTSYITLFFSYGNTMLGPKVCKHALAQAQEVRGGLLFKQRAATASLCVRCYVLEHRGYVFEQRGARGNVN